MTAVGGPIRPVFSFVSDGRSSRDFLSTWKTTEQRKPLGLDRTEVTRSYSDPQSGLEVTCVSVEFDDFPAVEWTVYFTNKGRTKTPILKDILGLDMRLSAGENGPAVLHWMRGDDNTGQSFAPQERPFVPGRPDTMTLAPNGGKSSDGVAPFFNLAWAGGGVAVAVGWTGQ
jgi:alpha-galactosidase